MTSPTQRASRLSTLQHACQLCDRDDSEFDDDDDPVSVPLLLHRSDTVAVWQLGPGEIMGEVSFLEMGSLGARTQCVAHTDVECRVVSFAALQVTHRDRSSTFCRLSAGLVFSARVIFAVCGRGSIR